MLDRKTAPSFQKSNSFALIRPERVTLRNGIQATFVRGGEQEVVKIELIFKAGKWQESRAGISYFTTHLLSKGTATKNSFQISTALDHFGMHLEVNPGYDFTSVALFGLTKNTERFFPLLYEIIAQPSFAEVELQQARDIYVQGLKINLEKTSFLASKQLRQSLFGKDHPYGRDAEVSDIESIQRQDMVSFHHEYFSDVEIITSGNITDALQLTLLRTFENFPVIKASERMVTDRGVISEPVFLSKENAVQSSVRLGKRMISRTHADYAALLLLNHIFGGFFGSRLMKNIREEKGLTYGIYSSMAALKNNSYLAIGADVDKENKELTIQEIKRELQTLREQPVGIDELETAKNHFIGSLQAEITTPFAHADKIKNRILYALPDDYYQTLVKKIDVLNAQQVQAAAQKYFDEESFAVVAVG